MAVLSCAGVPATWTRVLSAVEWRRAEPVSGVARRIESRALRAALGRRGTWALSEEAATSARTSDERRIE
jgi:hypothetical protein